MVRIKDAAVDRKKPSIRDALLTIWDADSLGSDFLVEGKRYLVRLSSVSHRAALIECVAVVECCAKGIVEEEEHRDRAGYEEGFAVEKCRSLSAMHRAYSAPLFSKLSRFEISRSFISTKSKRFSFFRCAITRADWRHSRCIANDSSSRKPLEKANAPNSRRTGAGSPHVALPISTNLLPSFLDRFASV